jgi:hypothetical protein
MGVEDDAMDQNEDTSTIQHHRFRLPNPGDLEAFAHLFRSTCSVAERVLVAFLHNFVSETHSPVPSSNKKYRTEN